MIEITDVARLRVDGDIELEAAMRQLLTRGGPRRACPVVLRQFGLVLERGVHPTRLVAHPTAKLDGDVVLRARSIGTEVDSC